MVGGAGVEEHCAPGKLFRSGNTFFCFSNEGPLALVMDPTRELALQIDDETTAYKIVIASKGTTFKKLHTF